MSAVQSATPRKRAAAASPEVAAFIRTLDNYDADALADVYADEVTAQKHHEVRAAAIRARMLQLAPGREIYTGERHAVVVVLSERRTLDRDAVTAALGAEWVARNTRTTLTESWRTSRMARG